MLWLVSHTGSKGWFQTLISKQWATYLTQSSDTAADDDSVTVTVDSMSSIQIFETADDRALAPLVGVALVASFTVLTGVGLFVYGEALVSGEQNPRVDAEFALEYTTDAEPELAYTAGEDFTPQDTHEIFATGTGENGTDYRVLIYDRNAVINRQRQNASEQSDLEANTTTIGATRMKGQNITSTATIQVVWVPENRQDTQIILSETVVPSRDVILQEIDSGGTVTANGDVVINGTQP